MKINQLIKGAIFISCISILPQCSVYDYGYGYDNYSQGGGVSSEYAYSSGRYDNDGFPIFGFQGGRPIYAYSNIGAPIFSVSLISSYCHVPSWRSLSHYHGHYRYSSHVHYHSSIPSCARQYREKHYSHQSHRPNRPNHNSHGGNNHNNHSTPVYNRPSGDHNNVVRPNGNSRPNRPDFNGGHSGPNRPNIGSNNGSRPNRPDFNGGNARPIRPSAESNSSRPSRPSFNGGNSRPSRPSGGFNSPRPSRPARPSAPSAAPITV